MVAINGGFLVVRNRYKPKYISLIERLGFQKVSWRLSKLQPHLSIYTLHQSSYQGGIRSMVVVEANRWRQPAAVGGDKDSQLENHSTRVWLLELGSRTAMAWVPTTTTPTGTTRVAGMMVVGRLSAAAGASMHSRIYEQKNRRNNELTLLATVLKAESPTHQLFSFFWRSRHSQNRRSLLFSFLSDGVFFSHDSPSRRFKVAV